MGNKISAIVPMRANSERVKDKNVRLFNGVPLYHYILNTLIDCKIFENVIIDTNVEELAVKEALKLNIPIVAIIDTNSDPVGIYYPIPGNDDARRAINLYCDLIKQTILDAQKNMNLIKNY